MKHDETKEFIDQVAYGEARVKHRGVSYFCNGVSTEPSTGICHIEIFPDDPTMDEQAWRSRWWHYKGKSRDDCMKAFLDVKYWDGKSFYDAAPEMEWID